MKKIITPASLARPSGFSHGILTTGGQMLFLAGQTAFNKEGQLVAAGDLVGQYEEVLRHLQAVVEEAGGTMQDIVKINIGGETIKEWPVYKDFIEADCLINVPIAKHHGLAGLTLGMKNWIGAVGGRRDRLHQKMNESVVDLAAFFKPKLTIMDAHRILVRNGPQGGSLEDVERRDTLMIGTDPVAVDTLAAGLFDRSPEDLPCLAMASARGLGTTDLNRVLIEEVEVG